MDVLKNKLNIGVVIPLFDKSSTLEACVSSIQAQSVAVDQIVIIDDRSTDDSYEKALAMATRDHRIMVIRQPLNGGAARARNAGASLVTTEWLAFLDADDCWEPNFVAEMSGAVARTGADFAGCGRLQIDRETSENFLLPGTPYGAVVTLDGAFWTAFKGYYPLNSSANLMRHALFDAAGGFPEWMLHREDHALWARLWGRGKCVFVNTILSRIEKAPTGLSRKPPRVRDLAKMILVLNGVLVEAARHGRSGSWALFRYLCRLVPGFARSYASHSVRRIAR